MQGTHRLIIFYIKVSFYFTASRFGFANCVNFRTRNVKMYTEIQDIGLISNKSYALVSYAAFLTFTVTFLSICRA